MIKANNSVKWVFRIAIIMTFISLLILSVNIFVTFVILIILTFCSIAYGVILQQEEEEWRGKL